MPARPPPSRQPVAGFTLVELLLVVVILGILSIVALPSATNERSEAVKSALKANVQAVAMQVEYRRQQTPDGSFWPTIEDEWFVGGNLPSHPDNMAGVATLETVDTPGVMHPRNKLITSGAPGAYWYNAANGAFRARVKSLPTTTETLAYYNEVNGSKVATLLATKDPSVVVTAVVPPGP